MGTEVRIEQLLVLLTKKEAASVRNRLTVSDKKECRLCLELFEVMRTARSGDEQKLINRLRSDTLKRHLSFYRGKLRETILDVLGEKQRDVGLLKLHEVAAEIRKCRALHAKGFRNAAVERLSRYAEKKELIGIPILRLLLLEEQHRILRASVASVGIEQLEENQIRKIEVLDVLRNMEQYNLLEEKVFDFYIRHSSPDLTDIQSELEPVFHDRLLKDEGEAKGTQAKLSYNTAHMLRSRLRGDKHDMVGYMERIVSIWEEDEQLCRKRPYAYQRALINLLNGYYSSHHQERFDEVYRKAACLKLKSARDRHSSIISLLSVRLAFHMDQRQLKDVYAIQKEVNHVLDPLVEKDTTATEMNLRFNLAVSYFLTDKVKKTKKHLHLIRSDKQTFRKDIQAASRILLMLSEYEVDNEDYLVTLKNEAKRYYRSNPGLPELGFIVFRMMNKLLHTAVAQRQSIFQEAADQLKQLPQKDDILGLEETTFWVRAQLQNRAVSELFFAHE